MDGSFTMRCPSLLELGFCPQVEESLFYGLTEIKVTGIGKNFDSEKKAMLPVKFETHSIY